MLLAPVTLYLLVVSALQAFTKADKAIAGAKTQAAKVSAEADKTIAAAITKTTKVSAEAEKARSVAAAQVAVASTEAAKTNAVLQWGIIVVIFIPIAFGLVIFGRYAIAGEYNINSGLQSETV